MSGHENNDELGTRVEPMSRKSVGKVCLIRLSQAEKVRRRLATGR